MAAGPRRSGDPRSAADRCATRAATSCARPATPPSSRRTSRRRSPGWPTATAATTTSTPRWPRSWTARTSRPPARSSPRTVPGRSTTSGSPASSCSTRSTTAACTTGSTAATASCWSAPTRAHNRGMIEFCAVDPRLLPTCYVPLADLDLAGAMAAEAHRDGRRRAARRVGLPARPLPQPRRPRPGLGSGERGAHPGRVPRRRHGRPDRPAPTSATGCRSRPTSTAARRTSGPSTTWASRGHRRRRWRR